MRPLWLAKNEITVQAWAFDERCVGLEGRVCLRSSDSQFVPFYANQDNPKWNIELHCWFLLHDVNGFKRCFEVKVESLIVFSAYLLNFSLRLICLWKLPMQSMLLVLNRYFPSTFPPKWYRIVTGAGSYWTPNSQCRQGQAAKSLNILSSTYCGNWQHYSAACDGIAVQLLPRLNLNFNIEEMIVECLCYRVIVHIALKSSGRMIPNKTARAYIYSHSVMSTTYYHRLRGVGGSVKSAIIEPHTDELVVRSVTISEHLLRHVFALFGATLYRFWPHIETSAI